LRRVAVLVLFVVAFLVLFVALRALARALAVVAVQRLTRLPPARRTQVHL
jgi:hypothetical protein